MERTLEGVNVTYTFQEEGDYEVTLTVTDARGNTGEAKGVVNIYPPPPTGPPPGQGLGPDEPSVVLVGGIAAAVVVAIAVLVTWRKSGTE